MRFLGLGTGMGFDEAEAILILVAETGEEFPSPDDSSVELEGFRNFGFGLVTGG